MEKYTEEQKVARRKARNEYNRTHYRQPPVSIEIATLEDFAAAVKVRNELEGSNRFSQAGIIRDAINKFILETDDLLGKK